MSDNNWMDKHCERWKARTARGLETMLTVTLTLGTLRLTGDIDWPWWAVACPLLLGAAIVVGGVMCATAPYRASYKAQADWWNKR